MTSEFRWLLTANLRFLLMSHMRLSRSLVAVSSWVCSILLSQQGPGRESTAISGRAISTRSGGVNELAETRVVDLV